MVVVVGCIVRFVACLLFLLFFFAGRGEGGSRRGGRGGGVAVLASVPAFPRRSPHPHPKPVLHRQPATRSPQGRDVRSLVGRETFFFLRPVT